MYVHMMNYNMSKKKVSFGIVDQLWSHIYKPRG